MSQLNKEQKKQFTSRPATIEELRYIDDLISKITIPHPLFLKMLQEISEYHQMTKNSLNPDGLCIFGVSGVGKTSMLLYYANQFPKQVLETYTKVPVLYVKLPTGSKSSKDKQIASLILKELGDPLYYKGTVIELTSRAIDLVQKCEVELIIFDEFQHIIDSDTKKVLRQAADWLRHLLSSNSNYI